MARARPAAVSAGTERARRGDSRGGGGGARRGGGSPGPHRGSVGIRAVGAGRTTGTRRRARRRFGDGEGLRAATSVSGRRGCRGRGGRRGDGVEPSSIQIGGEGGVSGIFRGWGRCRWGWDKVRGGARGGPAGWAWGGPVGPGPGGLLFPFFVLFSVLFCIFFYLFSFTLLTHFKILRHFLKRSFLHNNYQCIIWHPPNIFV